MKDLWVTLENSLIYIGYGFGFILFLENLGKLIQNSSETSSKVLLFASILWLISIVSRRFIFNRQIFFNPRQTFKIELLYFLFCHTFTTIFVTMILVHTPMTFASSYSTVSDFYKHSDLLNYLSRDFIFLLLVNLSFGFIFIGTILFMSKYLYKFTLHKSDYMMTNLSNTYLLRIFSFAFLIIICTVVINIPFVSNVNKAVTGWLVNYLRTHFQWLVDYAFGSPLVYYVYASFRGSALAEKFSLYRKFI